jgi:serine/threonine protein kinase/Tfp pilus assembly protein PilF
MDMPRLSVSEWQKIDELLADALERAPSERAAFVRAQAGDSEAAAAVLALLEEDGRAPAFLERGAVEALSVLDGLDPGRLAAGDRVGAYRLVQEIGRGGMSVVYLAERDDGHFQKRVAVKVLPVMRHLLPAHLRARFQSEREILAHLEHPAIARLLDGGETEGGEPYLVMEYVQGEPIDVYCDRQRLSLDERIALFLDVGEAVAYAHQNLVVHRDIKPSNVLVSAAGEVKLLDFGIAKVLSEPGELSSHTVTGERVMTPAYASPEQVRGDPIRTVSDVYSLGVLLYQLLTGLAPYKTSWLPHELATAILEQEPVRPSVAPLTDSGASLRATDERRLRTRLRGDLDAIILKALRKQPERRYASVEALLEDLRRYLARAPVTARGDDRWYRVGKLARRNWPAVAGTTLLLLVAGISGAYHAHRIKGERDIARREAATVQAVTELMAKLFEASNAWGESPQAVPNKITARALLDRATERIRTELSDQPEVRAQLLSSLGTVQSSLGNHEQAQLLLTEAIALRRRSRNVDEKVVAGDLDALTWVLFRRGEYVRAEAAAREAYEIRSRHFGRASAEASRSLHLIALNLRKLDKLPESEQAFRTALANLRRIHGDDNKDVALAMKGLAMVRRDRHDVVEAEALARRALEISEKLFGEKHPLTTEHRSDLATILRTKGDLAGAEQLFRQALEDNRAWFGHEHPNVALRWGSLALVLKQKKDLDGAEQALREALRINQLLLSPNHPVLATNLHNLGNLLREKGDLAGAQRFYEQALEMRRKVLPADHRDIKGTADSLAELMKKREEAAAKPSGAGDGRAH